MEFGVRYLDAINIEYAALHLGVSIQPTYRDRIFAQFTIPELEDEEAVSFMNYLVDIGVFSHWWRVA